MYTLEETVDNISHLGVKKAKKSFKARIVLGFIAGAMVAFGYMAYLRCIALLGPGAGVVVGAAVFPVGLIVVLFAGGELITGNMTVLGTSLFNKELGVMDLVKNWTVITLGNVLGAVFVAVTFTYFVGGVPAEIIADIASHKVHATAAQVFVSGIGCNWFVGLAVWLNFVFKDGVSKILAVWFLIMAFVVLGFQHSVANAYILTAGILTNSVTFIEAGTNFVFAYLGNIVGGAIFVGFLYTYVKNNSK